VYTRMAGREVIMQRGKNVIAKEPRNVLLLHYVSPVHVFS